MRLREEVRHYVIEARLREKKQFDYSKKESKKETEFLKKQEKERKRALEKAARPLSDYKEDSAEEAKAHPEEHKRR